MHPFALRLAIFACLLCLGRTAPADDPAPSHLLDRIAVVGASASFGFGARITIEEDDKPVTGATSFADVVDVTIRRPHQVTGHADLFFFTKSAKAGRRLLSDALRHDPTLLIGIDFLFWYGYGHLDHHGRPLRNEDSRLSLLEEGLDELEQVQCPLIVGDFPDMSPAVGRMLGENQMPEAGTLQALNQRLREWAAEHPNVTVLPLAEIVEQMRAGEVITIGDVQWEEQQVREMLQRDQLHPTADGLVALAQVIANLLTEDLRVSSEDLRLDPAEVRVELEERVRDRHEQRSRLFSIPADMDGVDTGANVESVGTVEAGQGRDAA